MPLRLTGEHRLSLTAFLFLSALCLAVAAAGLGSPARVLPPVATGQTQLRADSGSHHVVVGQVLVGRTSAPVPADPAVLPVTVTLAADQTASPRTTTTTRVAVSAPAVRHRTASHATRRPGKPARATAGHTAPVVHTWPTAPKPAPAPTGPGRSAGHRPPWSQGTGHGHATSSAIGRAAPGHGHGHAHGPGPSTGHGHGKARGHR